MKTKNENSLQLARLSENLIIGNGKMAKHFAHYLGLLKIPFIQVNRKDFTSLQIQEHIQKAQRIFLAISDSALAEFVEKNYIKNKIWIHFSGALSIANAISCHPLMSFSEALYKLEDYKKIHFVISGNHQAEINLKEIIPFIDNPYTVISSQLKEKYHAYCVIAGNFPIILWSYVMKEFAQWQIPEEALELYLQNNLNNFKKLKENALTGPLQRKDLLTIEKNINALGDDEKMQSIYKSFVEYKGIKI
jgi:predicted short-subunit dehydrogenase-like oxidoreductase (DUF2520 family)